MSFAIADYHMYTGLKKFTQHKVFSTVDRNWVKPNKYKLTMIITKVIYGELGEGVFPDVCDNCMINFTGQLGTLFLLSYCHNCLF